MAEAST